MGVELDELAVKIRTALERSLLAEHAGFAIRTQKKAIRVAEESIKDGHPLLNVPCYLPASVVVSLAKLGHEVVALAAPAEPRRL